MTVEGFQTILILSEEDKKGKGPTPGVWPAGFDKYWKGKMGEPGRGKLGSFTDCVARLKTKPGITNPEALCAAIHKREVGITPTQKHVILGKPIKRKGKAQKESESD